MRVITKTQLKIRAHICSTCLPEVAPIAIEDIEEFHPEITEPEQVDALFAWEEYWDAYKDVHGISPRHTSYTDHTAEEWEALNQKLHNQITLP